MFNSFLKATMKFKKMEKLIIIFIFILTGLCGVAQNKTKDDTAKKTVIITSVYKPVLRPSVKINLTAAQQVSDTSKPAIAKYNIPAQNLFFSYQPVSLKPLALHIEQSLNWLNSNYVKAGYGNYSSPYLESGLSFGDGKNNLINFFGKHLSQKGSLPFQHTAHTNFDILGLYGNSSNIEWKSKIGFDSKTQYFYGYTPDTIKFEKDSLRQRFQTITGMIGLRNKETNDYGINYNPTLTVNLFSDNHKGRETGFILNAPVSKVITSDVNLNLGFYANITTLKTKDSSSIKNNLFYLSPSVTLKKPNLLINIGILPSWDNGTSHVLPNISAVLKLKNEKFVLIGGWEGSYQKNTYQTLTSVNPWINQPDSLYNTRINEKYAGFKGSAGSHFTYNARLSFVNYNKPVLFLNDSADGKTFYMPNETSMKAIRISGEIGYTVQEKFSLIAGAVINNFSGLQVNEKAWGLLPLEITGSLRWQVLKDLQFKSDLFLWNGALYKTRGLEKERLGGAFDLNAGAEFKIHPKWSVWLQCNNILNNKYERWHQYQVLGLNVLAGVVYSF